MEWSRKNVSCVIPTRGDCDLKPITDKLKDYFAEIITVVSRDGVYSRFLGAKMAKFDTIYTQDDDCVVDNIPELIGAYKGSLVNNVKDHHHKFYKELCDNKITLIGWGAIFDKKDINFDKYLSKYPNDDLFKRECDRIFTWNLEKNEIITDKITEIERETKMSSDNSHYDDLKEIIKRLKTL